MDRFHKIIIIYDRPVDSWEDVWGGVCLGEEGEIISVGQNIREKIGKDRNF